MRIADILLDKGSAVVTMPPDASVRDLVGRLGSDNLGAVVVSEDGVRIVGIVSERDVVRRLAGTDCSVLLDTPVSDLMTTPIVSCRPQDSVTSVMATMTDRRIRHVPVVDADGMLAGIVSIGDMVKSRIGELQFERDQLEGYLASGR